MKNGKQVLVILLLGLVFMATLQLGTAVVTASSENGINRVVSISETYKGYPRTDLTIMEDDASLNDLQPGDAFLLLLPAGVKWYSDPSIGKATFHSDDITCSNCSVNAVLRTDQVVEITLNTVEADMRARMEIPLVIDVNGYLGDIAVTVDPVDSAVTGGEYLFAQVPYQDIKIPVVPPQPVLTTAVFKIGSASYSINGEMQPVMDVAPYLKGERAYLPLRFAAHVLGIDDEHILWDDTNQTVILNKEKRTVQVKIGSNILLVDGVPNTIDASPEISGDRTMLPIAPVAEAFGAKAVWDGAQQSVAITF